MHWVNRAGGLALLAALWLPGGLAQAGGAPVSPNVLQGLFVFNDEDQGSDNCSNIEIDGSEHQVNGVATGIGLSDDTVTLTYSTPAVDSLKAKSETGKVRQNRQSQLDVEVVPGAGSPTPAYTGTASPSKGSVRGNIRRGGSTARVRAKFQLGSGLDALSPVPDTNQLNTILAAYQNRDDVTVRENSGNVRIRQRGVVNPNTCPEAP